MTVFGLTVTPGDVLHADRHGAVVIPPAVVPTLAAAINQLLVSERIVLDATKAGTLDFAAFVAVWKESENART